MTIKDLLENPKYIKYIDENKFAECYDALMHEFRDDFTKMLHDEGINPLQYMHIIPKHFLDLETEVIFIPSNITKIGQEAFIGCIMLKDVQISEGVTIIDTLAFGDCVRLDEITIPNTVKDIKQWAFAGCFSLEKVHLGKSIEFIGNYAFKDCVKLTSISYGGTIEDWANVHVKGDAFADCRVDTIQCSDGITSIYSFED